MTRSPTKSRTQTLIDITSRMNLAELEQTLRQIADVPAGREIVIRLARDIWSGFFVESRIAAVIATAGHILC